MQKWRNAIKFEHNTAQKNIWLGGFKTRNCVDYTIQYLTEMKN